MLATLASLAKIIKLNAWKDNKGKKSAFTEENLSLLYSSWKFFVFFGGWGVCCFPLKKIKTSHLPFVTFATLEGNSVILCNIVSFAELIKA